MDKVQLTIAIGTVLAALVAVTTAIVTTSNFSKQLKLNFFADYTKRYQEIILNFPENINEDNFDFNKLSPDVKTKTLRYMRAYFDLSSEEYFLWRQNHIEDDVWKEWESGIKYAFSKTSFQKAWQEIIQFDTIYYTDFSNFINKIIKENTLKN